MKKIAISITGAVVGFLTIVGLHPSTPKHLLMLSTKKTAPSATSNPSTTGSGQPSGGNSGTSGNSGSSGNSGNSGSSGNSGTPTTTAPPAPVTGNGSTKSTTGPLEQFGYGELAVKVTVSNNKITNIQVVNAQYADPTSGYIESQAAPMLKSQALSAQSANISGVTGATYTSEAYATSLQSALTNLHFK